jgi:hypothetical protein
MIDKEEIFIDPLSSDGGHAFLIYISYLKRIHGKHTITNKYNQIQWPKSKEMSNNHQPAARCSCGNGLGHNCIVHQLLGVHFAEDRDQFIISWFLWICL